MSYQLLTAGTFLAISMAMFFIGRLLIPRSRNRPDDAEPTDSRRPLVLGRLTESIAYAFPVSERTRVRLAKELVQAGYYHRQALAEFLALRNSVVMVWIIFIAACLVVLAEDHAAWTGRIVITGTVGGVLFYSLPTLAIGGQARSRKQRIQNGLPDALDMLTMIMSGGIPMQAALVRVSQEIASGHPDLACELTIVGRQTEVGVLEHALRNFAQRIDLPDVSGLCALVSHTERLGSPIVGAFRDYADSIRRARRQLAEERGNKASVKLLFPVIFFLAPPIYILLLGPALLELRDFITRENQPGGVLAPSIPQRAAPPRRANAGPNPGPAAPSANLN